MSGQSQEDDLIHAVWRNDLNAIHQLLEAGADPNLPGRTWSSAIACAGENDESGEVIQLLVAAGADVNIQDDNGLTPLSWAVDVAIDGAIQCQQVAINWTVVGVLLDLGANPDLCDAGGHSIRDLVRKYGQRATESFEEFMRTRT